MKTYKIPENSVWAVRILTDDYAQYHTIAAFENLKEAAFYLNCTGIKAILEPMDPTSVCVRDVKIVPAYVKGWYV